MGEEGVWKGWKLDKFSLCVGSLLLLNASRGENLKKKKFYRPLQSGTEEYFM